MPDQIRILRPTPHPRVLRGDDGPIQPPEDWSMLPPGDATATRRVKAAGPHWLVQERRGRRVFSRGVWAPTATIEKVIRMLERERATPKYQRSLAQGRARRTKAQEVYVEAFRRTVLAFLDFDERHADLAERLASTIAEHATPVGSGTVARTQRIPVSQRAEAATIAWLRHATTAYDTMQIPREKGARREVRRMLAARSRVLLARYRAGEAPPDDCPLRQALS